MATTPPTNIAYKNVVKFIKDSKINNKFDINMKIKKYLDSPYTSKKSIIIKYYIWDVLKKKNIDENEKNKILLIINKLKDDNTVGSKAILIYIIDSIKIFKINSNIQKKNILDILSANANLKGYINSTAAGTATNTATNTATVATPFGDILDYKVGNTVSYTDENGKYKRGKIRTINGTHATVSFKGNMLGNKTIPIEKLEKLSSNSNVPIKIINRLKDRIHSRKIDIIDVRFEKNDKGKYIPSAIPEIIDGPIIDNLNFIKKSNGYKLIDSYGYENYDGFISSILIALSEKYRNIIVKDKSKVGNIIQKFANMFEDVFHLLKTLYNNFNIIVSYNYKNSKNSKKYIYSPLQDKIILCTEILNINKNFLQIFLECNVPDDDIKEWHTLKIDDCYIRKINVPKKWIFNKIDILDVIFKKDPIEKIENIPIYIPNKIPQLNYEENKDSLKFKEIKSKEKDTFKIISSYGIVNPQYSYISSILIAISEKYRNIIARNSHSAENIIKNFIEMFDGNILSIMESLYYNFNIIVEHKKSNGEIQCRFERKNNCLIITLDKTHDSFRVVKFDHAYAIKF